MPQLKEFLQQQVSLPLGIEASLPQGAPKLSQMMSQFALNLPQTPDLPVPGMGNGGAAAFAGFGATGAPDFANLIKGVDDMVPSGFPKFASQMPGYRATTEQGNEKKPTRRATMGGGYRGISV